MKNIEEINQKILEIRKNKKNKKIKSIFKIILTMPLMLWGFLLVPLIKFNPILFTAIISVVTLSNLITMGAYIKANIDKIELQDKEFEEQEKILNNKLEEIKYELNTEVLKEYQNSKSDIFQEQNSLTRIKKLTNKYKFNENWTKEFKDDNIQNLSNNL